jgi:imidazolonepropionase
LADLDVMLAHGTTTVEAKSGYGLDRVTELRLLRVMSTLHHPAEVVPTYLALHVPPAGGRGRREPYIDMTLALLDEARNMAEYCDVCCDPIGFSRDECAAVGTRAKELGYRIKLHADQTGWSGGAELASELKATSADHLDAVSANGIRAMANAGTVAVLLPAVSFHLLPLVTTGTETPDNFSRLRKLPSLVRELMHQGATVAIASDYNPGTAPTPSMQTAMRVAARLYRIDYPTVWQMATLNAARALDRDRDRGSLEIGKRADLVIWSVAEHGLVIHRFGTNLVDTVMKDGIVVVESGRPTYR